MNIINLLPTQHQFDQFRSIWCKSKKDGFTVGEDFFIISQQDVNTNF